MKYVISGLRLNALRIRIAFLKAQLKKKDAYIKKLEKDLETRDLEEGTDEHL